MLNRRFYYTIKPFLPWDLRMGIRRVMARRKRPACTDVWPIDETAGRPPAGWPGWPDGKKFALVLTHDVEGPEGLAKCQRLAELEARLGFRSCFNLIPEGTYSAPASLRNWLTEHGFEVGVHDLQHDGRLFSSRREFSAKANRINQYLQEWGAVGFRSGFMLRNLDWLHDLELAYDCSTFDTDPFEVQPDGTGTIFPFWMAAPETGSAKGQVARAKEQTEPSSPIAKPSGDPGRSTQSEAGLSATRSPLAARRSEQAATVPASLHPSPSSLPPTRKCGYVELPYTLPQDSTLFLLLQEKSPDIWLRKLDWLAAHGGMALVNVHPDYIQFEDEPPSSRTYPVAHYIRLLERVRERHAESVWKALPRQVAAYVRDLHPCPVVRHPKRVCMITYSVYESDNRVTRYAEALAARGDQVDVCALRRSATTPREEVIRGVNVFRIQDRFGKNEKSSLAFLWPVLRFLFVSSWWVTRRHARQAYDLVHVHNMPDFLVFAAWYPHFTGVKIILDIHDIVPELYSSKFRTGKNLKTISLLKWMERRSARLADHVIISNDLWLEKYTSRTGTRDNSSVYINNVDNRLFQPNLRTRFDDKLIVLFPGGLQWHQGLDIALHAFVRVSRELPQAEFHIYGDGNMKTALIALTATLGLSDKVRFFEPLRITEIVRIMANADLGVVPKRADSFGNEAYSTKIMEFMSLGVPVVISRTKIDQFYFNDSVVKFFDSGNAEALADGMLLVLRDKALREQMITNASVYAARNSWESRKTDYLQLVDSLCSNSPTRVHAP